MRKLAVIAVLLSGCGGAASPSLTPAPTVAVSLAPAWQTPQTLMAQKQTLKACVAVGVTVKEPLDTATASQALTSFYAQTSFCQIMKP